MQQHPLYGRSITLVLAMMLLGLAVPIAAQQQKSTNLLENPGFEQSTGTEVSGWQPFWSRTPGAGSMALDPKSAHAGQEALAVVSTDTQDWSVAQDANIPVKPGDILRFGGWVKSGASADAQISLVTRAADGTVQDWSYSPVDVGGKHDWQSYTRSCVIPVGCTSVQFRMIGTGSATLWLDDATLERIGNVPVGLSNKPSLQLTSRFLNVAVSQNGLLTVQDHRDSKTWHQQIFAWDAFVTSIRRVGPQSCQLALRDAPDDLTLTETISLSSTTPEISVKLAGAGKMTVPIKFPSPFVTGPKTTLVVPMNEGILFPVDDATVDPTTLVGYGGHGICMPWYGVMDNSTGAGMMTILQTPDDAQIEITRPSGGLLSIRPRWEPSMGAFRYERRLTYVFLDHGGYISQAKRYRQYAQQTGLFKTLAQKRKTVPAVDSLIGAVDVWNWDMDKVALCREMKSLGMTRVLWSNGGSPSEIAQINRLGYLTSRYDIYQDVYPTDAPEWMNKAGWPQDLVWLPNGDWMKGWADIEKQDDGTQKVYQGGVINSERGLARAKQMIPAELEKIPYRGRFLDTTTASPFREDYNPAHRLTRSQDRKYKMALLGFCSGPMKLVTGSETGIDPSVPVVDFYEGMMSLGPYRLPDAGYDMIGYRKPTPDFLKYQIGPKYRIPLWELVYHDCTVDYWYWGDATNKSPEVWPQRDLYNILYGTPPLFLFDKARWESDKAHFVQTYKDVCPLVRRLGYDEMLSHQFLTPDHTVQRTRWRSGVEVTINFGSRPFSGPSGHSVPSMGWLAVNLHGGVISSGTTAQAK